MTVAKRNDAAITATLLVGKTTVASILKGFVPKNILPTRIDLRLITVDNEDRIQAWFKLLEQRFATAADAILRDSVPESITEDIG